MDNQVPCLPETEAVLLSCILHDSGKDSIHKCIDGGVTEDWFYNAKNKLLFRHSILLSNRGVPIDEITLGNSLKTEGVFDSAGGDIYLMSVADRVESIIAINEYIDSLRKSWIRREVLRHSKESIERALDESLGTEELLNIIEPSLYKIAEIARGGESTLVTAKDMVHRGITRINEIKEDPNRAWGIKTGIKSLDEFTMGLQKAEVTYIAARPSLGKTSLGCYITLSAVFSDIPVFFVSAEMSEEYLNLRLAAACAGIDGEKIRKGFINDQQKEVIQRKYGELAAKPLTIEFDEGVTTSKIRSTARSWTRTNKNGMIVIDYLQYLKPVHGYEARISREREVAEMSRALKGMSKELNVPVVVLAQINRESSREKRKPSLYDLRESGSIEQDADNVIFIDLPRSAKGEIEDIISEDVSQGYGRTLIIAKGRNMGICDIPVWFNPKTQRWRARN